MVVLVLTQTSPGSDRGVVIGRNTVWKKHVLHMKFREQTFLKKSVLLFCRVKQPANKNTNNGRFKCLYLEFKTLQRVFAKVM